MYLPDYEPMRIPADICHLTMQLLLRGEWNEGVKLLSSHMAIEPMPVIFSDSCFRWKCFFWQAYYDRRVGTAFCRTDSDASDVLHEFWHHVQRAANQPYIKEEEKTCDNFAKQVICRGTHYKTYKFIHGSTWAMNSLLAFASTEACVLVALLIYPHLFEPSLAQAAIFGVGYYVLNTASLMMLVGLTKKRRVGDRIYLKVEKWFLPRR